MIPSQTELILNPHYNVSTALVDIESASLAMCHDLIQRMKPHETCAIVCGGQVARYGYHLAQALHQQGIFVVLVDHPDYENHEKTSIASLHWTDFIQHHWDWLVDATYAPSLQDGGIETEWMSEVKKKATHLVALHCPFGLTVQGVAYVANPLRYERTFALQQLCAVHVAVGSKDYVGEVLVVGASRERSREAIYFELLDMGYVKKHLPKRAASSHKGDNGRLLCFCGSTERFGAAMLACGAALRSGVGSVTLVSDPSVIARIPVHNPEIMYHAFQPDMQDDALLELVKGADCILMGCGSGRSKTTRLTLAWLLGQATCPLVVDGDGLFALKEVGIPMSHPPLVLTPHLLECARLFDYTLAELKATPWELVTLLATQHRLSILLKDANTFVSNAHGNLGIMMMGNSGQAKAGSGDVLAGVVASLIAQTKTVEPAIYLAPALCAHAANRVKAQRGVYNMLPSDVINELLRWD